MTIWESIKTALGGLRTNKTRSLLTILGIVIGITAIIMVMALGQGAKDFILNEIQGLGSKTIVTLPGREPSGPSDAANIFLDSLKERDLESIGKKFNVPYAEDVMPLVFNTVRLAYGSETYQATVLGGGNETKDQVMAEMFDLFPIEGYFFTDDEVRSKASVAVLGDKVREELLGDRGGVGDKIRINDRSFRVIGILPSKGQVSFFNFDDMVIVPYTTANQYILGRKHFDRIIVTATSEDKIAQTVDDITITLRSNHGITDPDKDDFFIQTQADLVERVGTITTALTAFLAAVASISLFVGGVGIMNIMLVSVTERTREIGLRKAVGATNKDILRQFLFESTILTIIGGIIGIAIGAALAFLTSFALSIQLNIDWSFTFPYTAAVLGIGVAAVVGLVFGIYPAREASKKSPIEALRYE